MNDINTWFNSWDRIGSIVVSAIVIYAALIVMIRISGKRTNSQMNNFDWIITVSLGSLTASGILLKNVSLADSVAAMACLILLQWIVTSLVIRSDIVADTVKSDPVILLQRGKFIKRNMKNERVSEAEVYAALRGGGMASKEEAECVILETDATLSVIPRQEKPLPQDAAILSNVTMHKAE